MKALITGSGGLIGSECVLLLCEEGWQVIGVDNDLRRVFFGDSGSTLGTITRLQRSFSNYRHYDLDIRNRDAIRELLRTERPNFIIHAAGQPSHELATSIPYEDFEVNALGTLNLLLAARDFCHDAPFCFTSTNKVYGDWPNEIPMLELERRYDYANGLKGIDESLSIDQALHSLFGASKLAADVLCQEFGRYFQMPIGVFRAGCMTGPQHAAVELHGFLAYIVRCAVRGQEYTIYGYKGKQVRDQIHCRDVAHLFLEFFHSPRCGEVYNLGGGRENSISVLEVIDVLDSMGYPLRYRYVDRARKGDHICYISDLTKLQSHFPRFKQQYGVHGMIYAIAENCLREARAVSAGNCEMAMTAQVRKHVPAVGNEIQTVADLLLPLAWLLRMERRGDRYWRRYPSTAALKLRWRAWVVRNCLHVLPGESILLFGAGSGLWAEHLTAVLRGRNPITALTFNDDLVEQGSRTSLPEVTVVSATDLEVATVAESFDYVIGMDLLCRDNYQRVLAAIYKLLKPGGQMLLFEANAHNPLVVARALIDHTRVSNADLLAALTRTGFTDLYLKPFDVIPGFMPPSVVRFMGSKLLVLEHIPALRALCGTVYVWCKKPGRPTAKSQCVDLAEHCELYDAVSVVVPCYNEEMNIRGLVTQLTGMYGPYIREIILVNDNSRDGTTAVISELARQDPRVKLVDREPPNGVGRALRDGFAAASGSYILSMDCDFVHLLPAFRDLFDVIAAGHDGAIGSRFSHSSVMVNYPTPKIVCNRLFHLLLKLLVSRTIRDITNNLKLYRADILKNLDIQEPNFAANLETGLKPLLAGYDIREVAISWIDRTEDMGTSSFKLLKMGPPYVRVLLRALVAPELALHGRDDG